MLMKVNFVVEVELPRMVLTKIGVTPFVVVGIPAYNEENSIARVVLEAKKFADVVVVCDDGSSDMTTEIAQRLGADVVRHKKNSGYGAAVKSLFERARELGAGVLITLDGDGQHDPREISAVLQPISDGVADIVIGSRFVDENKAHEMPLYRRFGAKLITKLINGSAKNGISDAQSGFRAYGKRAIECLSIIETGMGASVEILLEASEHNLRILEVPCSCKYQNGNVATSTKHPVAHGLGVVTSIIRLVVEGRPLVFLGVPGVLCLLAGVAFGVWMLQIYAVAHNIITNIALASLAFVLIGFFMLSSSITLYAISRLSRKINGKK